MIVGTSVQLSMPVYTSVWLVCTLLYISLVVCTYVWLSMPVCTSVWPSVSVCTPVCVCLLAYLSLSVCLSCSHLHDKAMFPRPITPSSSLIFGSPLKYIFFSLQYFVAWLPVLINQPGTRRREGAEGGGAQTAALKNRIHTVQNMLQKEKKQVIIIESWWSMF